MNLAEVGGGRGSMSSFDLCLFLEVETRKIEEMFFCIFFVFFSP